MPTIDIGPKKKKRRKRAPDEVFQAGPISMARYGRLIVAKNIATPKAFEEFQTNIPKVFHELEAEIRSGITELRTILAPLEPIRFLQQAFGEFFVAHLEVEDEPSLTFEEHGVPFRMIDYCQSLFAAMAPPAKPRHHTEDEFTRARECVRKIFQATQHYISLRAHPAISGESNAALFGAHCQAHLFLGVRSV